MPGEPILVVDDNVANADLMSFLLRRQGYDVRTAADATEALDILGSFEPRLIMMDIQLPGMDGLELTKRLKADPVRRSMLIIAITAYTMKGDEERALEAGCDGYVSKPIDTRALPRLISQFLQKTH
jgi:two-component system, cell cycle response regulator DivK